MANSYQSLQEVKDKHPNWRYFAQTMSDHPSSPYFVNYGDPQHISEKPGEWNVMSLNMSIGEAHMLADDLNNYQHNLKIGDRVTVDSERTSFKFMNGLSAKVIKIGIGLVTIQFDQDHISLPPDRSKICLFTQLIPI